MGAKPPKKATRYESTRPMVKIATSNLFIEPEVIDPDFATNLFFEDISGNELINIQSHNFLINTSNSNISNINSIVENYDAKSLFKSSNIQPAYFGQFEITFSNKVPLVGNGAGGTNVRFVELVDTDSINSLYIELINMGEDEEVEIEFLGKGTPIGDTIDL